MTAVMMGDLNGVTVAQLAHLQGLLDSGLLLPDDRLQGVTPALERKEMADIYIDDSGYLAAVRRDVVLSPLGPDFDRMAAVDAFYEEHNIPQSVKKAVRGVRDGGTLWGA